MKKKFYIIPQVEQLECRLFDALCSSYMPGEQGNQNKPGGMDAPKKRVF